MLVDGVSKAETRREDVPRIWFRCQASVVLLAVAHLNLNLNTVSHTVLNEDLNATHR